MSKQQLTNNREESGKLLQNNVKRIDNTNYEVKTLTSNNVCSLLATELSWICSCPDHMFRGVSANTFTLSSSVLN